jgi:hypothetical protein
MKIDEKANGHFQQFHVAQQLRLVDREDSFNRLEFHKDAILDQQVEFERLPKNKSLILGINLHLADRAQLAEIQLSFHASLVNGLDQPCALQSVYFNRSPDDLMR